ncbi:C39 family peptidase [Alkanindiges sp. WGS2144]|uniref:putative pilus system C39 family peptidase FilB n=1 Tax=Alkanindiges sp. WGS2144 TaxID=3366808 RepID=UPI003751653F
MFIVTLGSALIYHFATEALQVADKPAGSVYYTEVADSRYPSFGKYHREPVQVKPAIEQQFRGIVKQAYDYSCGSAALTTLLNGYVGEKLNERQTMDGLMRYGEYDRIVERRSFSLLDMKRFVTALGYNSGGYKGKFEDLIALDKPAIVPIAYAGFKHFVVYKAYRNGRVFVADPALGNLSFSADHFQEIWDNNTLFIVDPPVGRELPGLLALQEQDMRIVEDSVIDRFAFVDVRYPTLMMEKNADRAATMRRVLDEDPKSATYQQPIDVPLRLYYKRK